MKKNCVIVCGPTASGKTSLGIHLAKVFGGCILSADSMQIYKTLDIGTAKPTPEEQRQAPHTMIDICLPNESFSVARYQMLAKEEMEKAVQNRMLPILVGGTGLYIDSILYNTQFADIPEVPSVRLELEKEYDEKGGEEMLRRLREFDSETANRLSPSDKKRILRATEIYRISGTSMSELNRRSLSVPSDFCFLVLILSFRERQILYNRINQRVDTMLRNGLLEEAENLYKSGYAKTPTASQAIGYKELFGFFEGKHTLEQATGLLKQRSRNYAKRQITWFKRYDGTRLYVDEDDVQKQAEDLVRKFIEEEE